MIILAQGQVRISYIFQCIGTWDWKAENPLPKDMGLCSKSRCAVPLDPKTQHEVSCTTAVLVCGRPPTAHF